MVGTTSNFERIIREAQNAAHRRDREAQAKAKKRPFCLALATLTQLERLYRYRYGPYLPNDDAGWDDLELAFRYITGTNARVKWAKRWAHPEMPECNVH